MRIGFFLQWLHRWQFEKKLYPSTGKASEGKAYENMQPHIQITDSTMGLIDNSKDDSNQMDFSFETFQQLRQDNEVLKRQHESLVRDIEAIK